MIERMGDKALDTYDGHRALPRDLTSELKRGAYDVIARARYDARYEPETLRVLRAENAARERELVQERRVPDKPWQPRKRADIRGQPDVHLLDAERRVCSRESHVDCA